MTEPTKKNINDVIKPLKALSEGLSVLTADEWNALQAFCHMAIDENPATEEAMRLELGLPAAEPMKEEFADTTKLYAKLKTDCLAFRDEIRPGTIQLADDVVQYQRRVDVVYKRLIGLLSDLDLDGKVGEDKLKALLEAWKNDAPSPTTQVRVDFARYIGKLGEDASERAERARQLHTKLTGFQNALRGAKGEFKRHFDSYSRQFGSASSALKKAQAELQEVQDELAAAQKKRHDETIVLATSPLYLLIPFFGPFICAGVLLGVGIDYGLLIEKLKGKVQRLEVVTQDLGTKETFFEAYRVASELTDKTHEGINHVLPLVAKLEGAWGAMAKDLVDLQGILGDAKRGAERSDWNMASLDLETAQVTWRDLRDQADNYRRHGVAERVQSAEQMNERREAA